MNAFAYLRVSDPSQLKGDGFTRQRLAIDKHASANGLEIVQTFEERGLTGESATALRPAWSEMIMQCELQNVKIVVVEKLDRLARDLMVQETALRDMGRLNITVVSSMEPDLCSKDPTRVLIRQMLGALAQYDKNQIVARLRGARQRMKAATGRCEGRKPFGVKEGEDVQQIRDLHTKHKTLTAVADELNRLGVTTRQGRRWHANTVRRILNRA